MTFAAKAALEVLHRAEVLDACERTGRRHERAYARIALERAVEAFGKAEDDDAWVDFWLDAGARRLARIDSMKAMAERVVADLPGGSR